MLVWKLKDHYLQIQGYVSRSYSNYSTVYDTSYEILTWFCFNWSVLCN